MSFLVGEIGAYLLVATFIGALIAWMISRSNCRKATDALNKKIVEIQSDLDNHKRDLQEKNGLLATEQRNTTSLRGALASAEGNASLMESRWQNTLKTARQLPSHKRWVKSMQSKLAQTKVSLSQNRGYAEAMASKARSSQENLQRTHKRLTEVDAQVSNLKVWVNVFQQKLVKTKTEYAQLRNFATETDSVQKATRDNLQRVHTRLSEVDGKQQPLRTWIRVFQTKLKKTKTEYGQIRSYASNVQSKLDATSNNLTRVHNRLTTVTNELHNLKAGNDPSMPAIPPLAQVSDNKALRLVDKLRLLGTKSDDVYGRMNNQIREVRLDSVKKERVLTDSCEEKDAIINDLRQQLRKSENKAQKAPVEIIDQTVRIKELEADLARKTKTADRSDEIERIKKETIALRGHLASAEGNARLMESRWQSTLKTARQLPSHQQWIKSIQNKLAQSKMGVASNQRVPTIRNGNDDLTLIKGVGPKIERILNDEGITKFAQIAEWTSQDIEDISNKLGSFQDRITRDSWIEKARELHNEKYN